MQSKLFGSRAESLSKITRGTVLQVQIILCKFRISIARFQNKKLIIIFGTPTHNNIGDLAIAYAQTRFIDSLGSDYASVSMPFEAVMRMETMTLAGIIKHKDILMGHGGGNMGEMYLREELCRRKFIQGFPSNKIIIFPQTIHFSDTELGRTELTKTKMIYSGHSNLTVIPREQHSYEIMKKAFKANTVLFSPDIVLSLNASNDKKVRNGLLICLRNDQEAKVGKQEKVAITKFSKTHFDNIRYTDTVSHVPLFNYRLKNQVVKNKLDEFSRAQLVITDRLHGMVFAAITGTPCIALASFNHKVTNTYKWLERLPYIKFCNDIKNIDKLFKQIDINKTYDYNPAEYDAQWNKIRNEITGAK